MTRSGKNVSKSKNIRFEIFNIVFHRLLLVEKAENRRQKRIFMKFFHNTLPYVYAQSNFLVRQDFTMLLKEEYQLVNYSF